MITHCPHDLTLLVERTTGVEWFCLNDLGSPGAVVHHFSDAYVQSADLHVLCPNCKSPMKLDPTGAMWECAWCLYRYTPLAIQKSGIFTTTNNANTISSPSPSWVDRTLEKLDNMAVELRDEPVIAQRIWQLDCRRMSAPMAGNKWDWFLEGRYGREWESGEMTASCVGARHAREESPYWGKGDKACLCGINAYKLTVFPDDMSWATSGRSGDIFSMHYIGEPSQRFGVVGIVELGGEVHEYQLGYRAEHALMIEATILADRPFANEWVEQLEEKYQCPFRVATLAEWQYEWEATYGRDRKESQEDPGTQAGASGTTSAGATQATITASNAAARQRARLAQLMTASIANDPFQWLLTARPTRADRIADWWNGLGWKLAGGFAGLVGITALIMAIAG